MECIREDIVVSNHGYDRMKERFGLNRKAAARMARKAYLNGINPKQATGCLKRFITDHTITDNLDNAQPYVYGENLFCFVKTVNDVTGEEINLLTTAFKLPKSLLPQVLSIQKKNKRAC